MFIAEVSSNHNCDLKRCFDFIDTAADIGCTAVKYQLFRLESLFAPEILNKSEEHRRRKKWELSVDFLPKLSERCHEKNIHFSCTPFDLQAVTELEPYVDFYKISSYDILRDDLLIKCSETKKPVVISTGMATMDEISHLVKVMSDSGCKSYSLLHCVSNYPTKPEMCNLAAIDTLRKKFVCPVGWSDHSVSPAVINRAVNHWGAEIVEFHLDLDGRGEEYEGGHCWLPNEMKDVIDSIRIGELADGDGVKTPAFSEMDEREWRADPKDGLRPFQKRRSIF